MSPLGLSPPWHVVQCCASSGAIALENSNGFPRSAAGSSAFTMAAPLSDSASASDSACSRAALARGIANSTGDAELQRELALAYLKLGDVQGRLYSANTGNTEGSIESYRKAVALLESAHALQPNDMQVISDLIGAYDALLFSLNRAPLVAEEKPSLLERSGQLLQRLSSAKPNDTSIMIKLAMFHIRSGDAQGNHGDLEGLRKKLELHTKALPIAHGLELIPDNDPIRLQTIARTYQRLGTDHMWLGEEAVVRGDRDRANALFLQSIPYHEKMVAFAERLAAIESNASESRRVRIAAYSSIAESLGEADQRDRALDFAGKALRLAEEAKAADPGNREADMELGNIYAIIGKVNSKSDLDAGISNYAVALEHLRRVVRRDAGNLEAASRIGTVLQRLVKLSFENGDNRRAAEYQRQLEQNTPASEPSG
jgi:tetratricopeptide (TPR) repeat protein